MGTIYEKTKNPGKKSTWGIPFLAALSIGFADNAEAQNHPRSPDPVRAYLLAAERENDTSWEIPDLSPGVRENCRSIAAQQITQVLRGGELNGGNLCSYDDVPEQIKRMDAARMEREDAADGGRARRAREAEARALEAQYCRTHPNEC